MRACGGVWQCMRARDRSVGQEHQQMHVHSHEALDRSIRLECCWARTSTNSSFEFFLNFSGDIIPLRDMRVCVMHV